MNIINNILAIIFYLAIVVMIILKITNIILYKKYNLKELNNIEKQKVLSKKWVKITKVIQLILFTLFLISLPFALISLVFQLAISGVLMSISNETLVNDSIFEYLFYYGCYILFYIFSFRMIYIYYIINKVLIINVNN